MTCPASDVTLVSSGYRAVISTVGAGPRHLSWNGRDLLEGYGEPGQPEEAPLSANVVLAPWPNRTRDAEFTVAGRTHRLEMTEPGRRTAIHGFVSGLSWDVVAQGEDHVTLTLDPGTRPGWPWPTHLEISYRLTGAGLDAELLLRNDTDTASDRVSGGASVATMPVACGFHLYPSALGAPTDGCTLRMPSHTVLPLDDRNLPAGGEVADTDVLPDAATVLDGQLFDHCLHGAGEAATTTVSLRSPDGSGVELTVSPELRWFQVFTPDERWGMPYPGRPGGRAVAVEPMTAPPDALNSGTDLRFLEPGETFTCGWTVRVLDG